MYLASVAIILEICYYGSLADVLRGSNYQAAGTELPTYSSISDSFGSFGRNSFGQSTKELLSLLGGRFCCMY